MLKFKWPWARDVETETAFKSMLHEASCRTDDLLALAEALRQTRLKRESRFPVNAERLSDVQV